MTNSELNYTPPRTKKVRRHVWGRGPTTICRVRHSHQCQLITYCACWVESLRTFGQPIGHRTDMPCSRLSSKHPCRALTRSAVRWTFAWLNVPSAAAAPPGGSLLVKKASALHVNSNPTEKSLILESRRPYPGAWLQSYPYILCLLLLAGALAGTEAEHAWRGFVLTISQVKACTPTLTCVKR